MSTESAPETPPVPTIELEPQDLPGVRKVIEYLFALRKQQSRLGVPVTEYEQTLAWFTDDLQDAWQRLIDRSA